MKNCIITGANSGIGFQAAKQIASKGYHVTLICRNKQRAEEAVSRILAETHDANVDFLLADLSSMEAIKLVVDEYLSINSDLDVLINNAADFDLSVKTPIMTPDGLEKANKSAYDQETQRRLCLFLKETTGVIEEA